MGLGLGDGISGIIGPINWVNPPPGSRFRVYSPPNKGYHKGLL